MADEIKGKRIAILVADGFEQVEMTKPRQALDDAGAKTELISPAKGEVQGWARREGGRVPGRQSWTPRIPRSDALLLPGGVQNPDHLRMIPKAVEFVKSFFREHKSVAAICHGPWLLVEAGVVRGRRVTSWPSLKTDLTNAGAKWTDEAVVADYGVVTSRKPDDISAFNKQMIEVFRGGIQASRGA
jgi:protease I